MNILHILSESESYDVVSSVIDLSTKLIDNDCNCIIASPKKILLSESSCFSAQYELLPRFEKNIINMFKAYVKLRMIVKKYNIDILHSHSAIASWIALGVSRASNIPLVTTCHDFYSKSIIASSLLRGKKIVVHNEAVGSHLLYELKIPRQHISFIPEGIGLDHVDFIPPDQRSKTDFNIGILLPMQANKGHEYFLKSMVKVVRTVPTIKIWIATSMPGSKEYLKKDFALLVRRLGLERFVEFFEMPDIDFDIISSFNILVSVSTKEDASTRVILEAQARGVPVIVSQVGGFGQIIKDGKTGIVVPPKDHNALAAAIIKILRNIRIAREITNVARRKIEEDFNINNTVDRYFALYNQVKLKKTVLVINLGLADDVMFSIPTLRALRKELPNTEIVSLVHSRSRCVLSNCPYVDNLIIYDSIVSNKDIFGFIRIVKLLADRRYDSVVDLTNTFMTHILSYLTFSSQRYGYRGRLPTFFINHAIPRPNKAMNAVRHKLMLLRLLNIKPKDYGLEIWFSEEDKNVVGKFFRDNWIGKEKVALLDISTQKSPNRYKTSVKHLAYLCDKLAKHDMRVIVTGAEENIAAKEELFKKTKSRPISAVGSIPLTQRAYLIKQCDIYISSNQRSLQIADTLKKPSIILSSLNKASKKRKVEFLSEDEIRFDMRSQNRKKHLDNNRNVIIDKVKTNRRAIMKILHITTHLNRGGIASYIASLAVGLKEKKHDVVVASSSGDLEGLFVSRGIECVSIPIKTKNELSPKMLASYFILQKYLAENYVDIIHAHTRVTQVLGYFLSKVFKIPLVTTCHGFFRPRWHRKKFPCWGDKVIAISNSVKQQLISNFNVRDERISLVHSGIDSSNFRVPELEQIELIKREMGIDHDSFVIGFAGRFSDVKGLDYLIKSAVEVSREKNNIKFLLIGYGKEEDKLKQLVKDLKIEDKVVFFKPKESVTNYLCAIDIFIMPSLQEGLGLSILEAQAYKIPVIASNVGGIPDIIKDKETGLLINPRSEQEISKAIKVLIMDKELFKKIQHKAYGQLIEHFSLSGMIEKTQEVYRSLHVV